MQRGATGGRTAPGSLRLRIQRCRCLRLKVRAAYYIIDSALRFFYGGQAPFWHSNLTQAHPVVVYLHTLGPRQ
jgi:hypothetical protein